MAMGDRYRENDRGRRPPKAKAVARSNSTGRSSNVAFGKSVCEAADGIPRRVPGIQAGASVGAKRKVQGTNSKMTITGAANAASPVPTDSLDSRGNLHAGYTVTSVTVGRDDLSSEVPRLCDEIDRLRDTLNPGSATLTIQRWWRRQVRANSSRFSDNPGVRDIGARVHDAGNSSTFLTTLSMSADSLAYSRTLHQTFDKPEFIPEVLGVHAVGQRAEVTATTNYEHQGSHADSGYAAGSSGVQCADQLELPDAYVDRSARHEENTVFESEGSALCAADEQELRARCVRALRASHSRQWYHSSGLARRKMLAQSMTSARSRGSSPGRGHVDS